MTGNAVNLNELTTKLVRLEGDADKLNAAGLRKSATEHGGTNATAFVEPLA